MKLIRYLLVAVLATSSLASCASTQPSSTSIPIVGSGTFVSEDGKSIRADYFSNDTVTLTLPDGSTQILNQAVSASGSRYVSGQFEWWEHQGEATYSVNDKQAFSGKLKK